MSTSFSLNKKVAFKKKKKVLKTSVLGFGDDDNDDNNGNDEAMDPVESKKEEVRRANEQIAAQANAAMKRTLGLQAEAMKQDPNIFNYDDDYGDGDQPSSNKPARTMNVMPHVKRALREEDEIIEEDAEEEEYRYGLIQMKNGNTRKGNTAHSDGNTAEEAPKSKYIETLLQSAKRRDIEQDIIKERQLVREREKDDELYGDKPKFVTSAYKKVLEERQALREEHERIEDNTGLNNFYKGLLEQKKQKEGKSDISNDNDISAGDKEGGASMQSRTEEQNEENAISGNPRSIKSDVSTTTASTEITSSTVSVARTSIPSKAEQHKALMERIEQARAAFWVRRNKSVTA
jgi:coiled-coil domain-containing protein 55